MIETRYRKTSISSLERKASSDTSSDVAIPKATEELAKDRTLRNSKSSDSPDSGQKQVRAFARVRGESKAKRVMDADNDSGSLPASERGSLSEDHQTPDLERLNLPKMKDSKALKSLSKMNSMESPKAREEQNPRSSVGWKGTLRLNKVSSSRSATDQDINKILTEEQYVSREAALIILDICFDFIQDFDEHLQKEKCVYMAPLVNGVICSLLHPRYSRNVIQSTLEFLRLIVLRYPSWFFVFKTSSIPTTQVMRRLIELSNTKDHTIRAGAGALIYAILRGNFSVKNNLAASKLRIALSISEMAGKVTDADTPPPDFDFLESVLLAVARLATDEGVQFAEDLNTLQQRLSSVIAQSDKLHRYRHDPEMTAEIYHQISLGYTDSPELRVTWLMHLSDYYVSREQWEEAAHCRLFIANLLIEYLNTGQANALGFPTDRSELTKISPNVVCEPPLSFIKGDDHILENFTADNLISHFKEVIAYLERVKTQQNIK